MKLEFYLLIRCKLMNYMLVGFISASIRSVADARVGATIIHYSRKAEQSPPGYKEATSMVFCGLFPVDADQYISYLSFFRICDALEKLQLNDATLKASQGDLVVSLYLWCI